MPKLDDSDLNERDMTALLVMLAALMSGNYNLNADTVRNAFSVADAFMAEREARKP